MKILAYSDVFSWVGFKEIIRNTDPDILVLNGDLVGDGWRTIFGANIDNKLEYQLNHFKKFYEILRYASTICKKVLVIKGNHDNEFYNSKFIESIPNCIELSGKGIVIEGLSFFGFGYKDSYNVRELKSFLKTIDANILITHTKSKRLPILASIEPKLIIQGHSRKYGTLIENVSVIYTDNQINLITINSDKKNNISRISNKVIGRVPYNIDGKEILETNNQKYCKYCGNRYSIMNTIKEKHNKKCNLKNFKYKIIKSNN